MGLLIGLCVFFTIWFVAYLFLKKCWFITKKNRAKERDKYNLEYWKSRGDFHELIATLKSVADNKYNNQKDISLYYHGREEFTLTIRYNGINYEASGADPWLAAEKLVSNSASLAEPIRRVLDKQNMYIEPSKQP